MATGMVLEGGAMRGMYTAGVLDAMMDAGIDVDQIVGVSAGALFGVNYFSGQRGRVIRYNKRFNPDPDYLGLRPLLREGNIVSTPYAYERVPHELDPFRDDVFRASGRTFHAVVTNVHTGQPEYVQISSVFEQMDVLRASGSMPLVSRPVQLGENAYLDGGISDSIPYRWLSEQGCEKMIVVLTRDASYRKKPVPSAIRLPLFRYPKVAEQMINRHLRYQECLETLRQWEKAGRVFVIRPSRPITIGTIEKNPAKLQAVYDLGQADAAAVMEKLQQYLQP